MNIKRIPVLVLVLLFLETFTPGAGAQESPYYLIIRDRINKNHLGLNEFYPIHHLNQDIFLRFDLIKKIERSDRARYLKEILNNLSYKEPVHLIVKNYQKGKDLILAVRLQKTGNSKSPHLLLVSNYDVQRKKIIRENGDFQYAYAKLYYIAGEKLVYYGDEYNKKKERELRKKNNLNSLASYYLFDDLSKNDKTIKPLLEKAIQIGAPDEKLIARLTLSQYYLLKKNIKSARHQVKLCRKELTRLEKLEKKEALRGKKAEKMSFSSLREIIILAEDEIKLFETAIRYPALKGR